MFGTTEVSDKIRFTSFGWAFLQTFCVMVGENWVTIMYDVSYAYGSKFATWYFLAIVIFGDYFFLNLVLAVVLRCVLTQHLTPTSPPNTCHPT